jgi:hypothetical protein
MESGEQVLRQGWIGLMLSMALMTAAAAAPPAADPPAQAPAQAQTPPAAPPPDDSLFEYLGTDDVEDARWWDFLMRKPPAQPPTQEAGK